MSEPCTSSHDVLDREVRALRALMDARLSAIEKSADLAREVTQAKFEQANEWRLQLDRERADFLTRAVFDASIGHLRERLADVDKRGAVSAAIVSLIVSVLVGLLLGWGLR